MNIWTSGMLAVALALGAGASDAQESSTYLYDVHGRLVSNGTAAATTNSSLATYSYNSADNRTSRQASSYAPRANVALLLPGETLVRGEAAVSDVGQSRFELRQNGSLVLSCNGLVQVTFQGANNDAAFLSMQGDGNLVLHSAAMTPLWSSDTNGNPGAYFAIQGDGNAVIYLSATPLWSTSTSC